MTSDKRMSGGPFWNPPKPIAHMLEAYQKGDDPAKAMKAAVRALADWYEYARGDEIVAMKLRIIAQKDNGE